MEEATETEQKDNDWRGEEKDEADKHKAESMSNGFGEVRRNTEESRIVKRRGALPQA